MEPKVEYIEKVELELVIKAIQSKPIYKSDIARDCWIAWHPLRGTAYVRQINEGSYYEECWPQEGYCRIYAGM